MSEKRKDSKGRVLRTGESQRKDGKYMYRYTDPDGNRKTVYSWKLVATDRIASNLKCDAALRDIERRIEKDLEDGIYTSAADNVTVNMLFDAFMELRIDLRSGTRYCYLQLYNHHVRQTLGKRKVKTVKFTDVKGLYAKLVKEDILSEGSVRIIHAILVQLFDNAIKDNLIRTNPASGAFKTKTDGKGSAKQALTEEQQFRFVEYIRGSEKYERFAPLITVLLGTGMRIGEALGLRKCDCDFEKNTISINHTLIYRPQEDGKCSFEIDDPKTKSGNRVIPMFDDVRKALLYEIFKGISYNTDPYSIGEYTGFIFLNSRGRVYAPTYIYYVIQNIVRDYNEDEAVAAENEHREPVYLPSIGPHILRHTFCTRMCENEPNLKIVQEVMGHSNMDITMSVYNNITEKTKQDSFKRLDGKLKLA